MVSLNVRTTSRYNFGRSSFPFLFLSSAGLSHGLFLPGLDFAHQRRDVEEKALDFLLYPLLNPSLVQWALASSTRYRTLKVLTLMTIFFLPALYYMPNITSNC